MTFSSSPKVTPARKNYLDLKRQHPDYILLFQMGDFYEAFDEDAQILADKCDVVLTSRFDGIKMAGVPFHVINKYVDMLIKEGYQVAVAAQTDVDAKGHPVRYVSRIVTPESDIPTPPPYFPFEEAVEGEKGLPIPPRNTVVENVQESLQFPEGNSVEDLQAELTAYKSKAEETNALLESVMEAIGGNIVYRENYVDYAKLFYDNAKEYSERLKAARIVEEENRAWVMAEPIETKIETKTLTVNTIHSTSFDRDISGMLNDGWRVAHEQINTITISGGRVEHWHTIRFERTVEVSKSPEPDKVSLDHPIEKAMANAVDKIEVTIGNVSTLALLTADEVQLNLANATLEDMLNAGLNSDEINAIRNKKALNSAQSNYENAIQRDFGSNARSFTNKEQTS